MLGRAGHQDGFTLIELMVTITLSMIVLLALTGLIDTGGQARARLSDKTETVQRMRNGMDRITRVLRTQVCADTATPPLISATASAVSFYSETSTTADNSAFRPRKVELAYDTSDGGSVVQKVYEPTNAASPWSYPGTPTRTNTLIDNVAADAGGSSAIFRYYSFSALDTPLALPLDTSLFSRPTAGQLGGQGHEDRRDAERAATERQYQGRAQHRADQHRVHPQRRLLRRLQRRPELGTSMRLTSVITTLRRRLAGQDGFTMVAVMAGMLVVVLVSVAAIAAASGDIGLARGDQDDKQAYAAAEAGINDYLGNLNTDTNYWAKCTATGLSPVNQKGVDNASRKWRDVPGSANSEYSIELIPAPGYDSCNIKRPRQDDGRRGQHQDPLHRPGQEHDPHPDRNGHLPPRRLPGLPLLHRLREPGPVRDAAHHVGARQPCDRHQRQPDRRPDAGRVGRRQVRAPLVGHPGQQRARGVSRSPRGGAST